MKFSVSFSRKKTINHSFYSLRKEGHFLLLTCAHYNPIEICSQKKTSAIVEEKYTQASAIIMYIFGQDFQSDIDQKGTTLIDCMVLNTVFKSISVVSWQPVHLSMLSWSSFNQFSAQYSFQATGCFPT